MEYQDQQWLQIVIIAGALILALVVYTIQRYSKSAAPRMPPGPSGWPFFGNLLQLGQFPHRDLMKLSQQFGPIITLKFGSKPVVVVSSAELARQCLKLKDVTYASRPRIAAGDILGYDSSDIVFNVHGADWRLMRRAISEELLQSSKLIHFQGLRKDETMILLRSVLEASRKGESLLMLKVIGKVTGNVISRMLMSECFQGPNATCTEEEGREIADLLQDVTYCCGALNLGDWIPSVKRFDLQGLERKMKAMHSRLDALLQSIINKRREKLAVAEEVDSYSSGDQNFIDAMLRKPPSERISDKQMKSIITDVFVAATETTSSTFEWTLTELIRNQEVMSKLQAELDRVVGRERVLQETDLPKLEYLRSVIKESMRFHTVVPLLIPHTTTENSVLAGYEIPANTILYFNIFAIHQDPTLWKNPDKFLPERFEEQDVDVQGQHFQLLPFGSGRRMCPGVGLAMTLLQYTLGLLLHAFNWSLPEGQTPDTSEKWGLNIFKAVPLELLATPRLDSQAYDRALGI